jgi:hypothetical protein
MTPGLRETAMSPTQTINDILARVETWPVEQRAMLAHPILRDMRIKALADAPCHRPCETPAAGYPAVSGDG